MDLQKKKCSIIEHANINANIYCKKCEIYMSNKCENYHSKLFQNHQNFIVNKNIEDLNDEFCEEETHHYYKLEYYCISHKKLCCAACIAKMKGKNNGQHSECKISYIEDIKEEKKNGIKKNIKLLEELSSKFNESYNEIKKIYEEINENKEKLKLKIQKIFTSIRNIINNREDELLDNVDKEFENSYFKDNFMKDIEKLPNKINSCMEKCKNIDEIENNICKLIKESAEIENNINIINNINSNIKNIEKATNNDIQFIPEKIEQNNDIENLKSFGKILVRNKFVSDNMLKKSSIIKDDKNSLNSITNWILETINKDEIKFELIFKMSENGNKSDDFHKYCDNKGPTLTLVKTTKNKIFGGFTPLNWKNKGYGIKDSSNQTFIFSLNLNKKFNMINQKGDGIYCSSNYGPNFGNCDFDLKENMKNGETYANNYCNFLSNNNLELTGGKGDHENFDTEELEVYKVIY